jgi:dihydroorotate dehydrogenase (fumarate)
MDLSTTYLGLRLPHPLIVGARPLTGDLDMAKALEDAGAAALVLRTLFEDESTDEQMDTFFNTESHDDSFAEASGYTPEPDLPPGPEEYLEHLRRVKQSVRIPVIASLSGVTPGGWVSYARLIDQAGADAIELNLFHPASDMTMSAADVDRQAVEIVRSVKQQIRIPAAVKITPLQSAFAHFARQLDAAGADGLVLFTRFHHADIDVEALEIVRSLPLSDPKELSLRLRGTAALAGRIKASLAISGGVHSAVDVIKATMAGAHVTQMVSALLLHGPGHLRTVRAEIEVWMREHEWDSLGEMRANMSLERLPDPAAYERANFRMALR